MEPVNGKFDDVTDIILGGKNSSEEESSEVEAPGEEVKDMIVSGVEKDRVE